jgi:hypothetical protein
MRDTLAHLLSARLSPGRIAAAAAELEVLASSIPDGGPEAACARLGARLREAGAHFVELGSYPVGPEHRTLGWSEERRPIPEVAEIHLVEEGHERLLARRLDDPASFLGAYRSTAPDGELFEVENAGLGSRERDYRGLRLEGRVALVSGHDPASAELLALVEKGAEGLLVGPGAGGDGPVAAHAVSHRLGEASLFAPRRPFAFRLTASATHLLLSRLSTGEPVTVRVRLRLATPGGSLPLLLGGLEGSDLDGERVLLLAELGQPHGALAAACLEEILRALSGLVVEGALPPLRRRLELLVSPSPLGTLAWAVDALEAHRAPRAAIELAFDDGAPDPRAAAPATVETRPGRLATFLSDLLEEHLRRAAPELPLEATSSRAGSSAHLLGDPDVGVQAARLGWTIAPGAAPPRGLLAAVAAAACDLASLGEEDHPRLIATIEVGGLLRLGRRARRLRTLLAGSLEAARGQGAAARHLLHQISASLERGLAVERRLLESSTAYLGGPGASALALAEAEAELAQTAAALARALRSELEGALPPRVKLESRRQPLAALERRAGALLLRRRGRGPLPPLSQILRDARPEDRLLLAQHALAPPAAALDEILDEIPRSGGEERSLLELHDAASLEGPCDLRALWRHCEALAGAGLLELSPRPGLLGEEP